MPARGDVDGTSGPGALPQPDDQSIRTAFPNGTDVFRTLQTNTEGTIAQAGFRHGCDHIRMAHRRSLGSLHRYDQAMLQLSTIKGSTGKTSHGVLGRLGKVVSVSVNRSQPATKTTGT